MNMGTLNMFFHSWDNVNYDPRTVVTYILGISGIIITTGTTRIKPQPVESYLLMVPSFPGY